MDNFDGDGPHITDQVKRTRNKLVDSLVEKSVDAIQIKMRQVILPREVPVLFDALLTEISSTVRSIKYKDCITTIYKKLSSVRRATEGPRRKRGRRDDNNNNNNNNNSDSD